MGLFSIVEDASPSGGQASVLQAAHKSRLKSKDDKKPKAPEKTAEQLALEKRQQIALDKETEENERRLKQMARGTLGAESLLSGAQPTQQKVVSRGGGGGGGGGSLLSGAGGAASGGGSGSGPTSGFSGASRPKGVSAR